MQEKIIHRTGALPMGLYHTRSVSCHWHEEMEFICPIDGPCYCYVDAVPIKVEVGQALLIRSRQLHTLQGERKVNVVVFHPDICGPELSTCFLPERQLRCLYDERDKTVMDGLRALFAAPEGYGQELLRKGYMLQVMGAVAMTGEGEMVTRPPIPFAKVLSYVEEHACEAIGLQEVAQKTNFSMSYITHAFRRYTGQSFTEFVNTCRLHKAAERLRSSADSVLAVATECGFESVSYFIKLFKQRYGTTPHRFRKVG